MPEKQEDVQIQRNAENKQRSFQLHLPIRTEGFKRYYSVSFVSEAEKITVNPYSLKRKITELTN